MRCDALKDVYAGHWTHSQEREERLSAAVSRLTGVRFVAAGLGTGSSDRIAGNSVANGLLYGTADYRSECGAVALEVTGPHKAIPLGWVLWVTPHKLAAAREALARGTTTFLVHETPVRDGRPVVRVVPLTARFLDRAARFRTTVASPFGIAERFVCVPADDRAVLGFDAGCRVIREVAGAGVGGDVAYATLAACVAAAQVTSNAGSVRQ